MKINWNVATAKHTNFTEVPLNAAFVNANGKGAVYIKVILCKDYGIDESYYMMEIATGKLYPPTNSPVEILEDVTINLPVDKPALYS